MKAVLFDIDDTIMRESQAHRKAFYSLFKQLNLTSDLSSINVHGMTDRRIIHEAARLSGVKVDLDKSIKILVSYFMEYFNPSDINLLPGSRETINALKQFVKIGIVTGNCRDVAVKRLSSAKIDFEVGGFGDKFIDRTDVVREAIKGLIERYGEVEVYVIGDTPRDIEAGKKNKANTIGVATGVYSREDLGDADLVINNLEEREKLLSFIMGKDILHYHL
ncbi:HAD family hydrolase [Acidianus sp. RZ1]|uniref:HAD family hydrolase n=1 Tax=Acidianus sp. RZ1 TaxID=1540082 RepID=UPI001492A543|nr:HAD hydrolase-like protein [Acidianus sp. RZ1]NON63405.1 HAD family hydrolase [Acidianus sp. RZ1]